MTQEQIAARRTALTTVQPGDLIIFEPHPGHAYTYCVATAISEYSPDIIKTAWTVRTYEGVLAGMEPAGMIHIDNLVECPLLRIVRASEGAI